ncbi:LysE family translocator [uncultured Roseobacter sp.]|uniref:LysE family translocator n=1 Tax=uncultured Roseobacter sp. TaxID=114847 RepID=UPI002637E775|nr:LysE family translocator [uncultured Roseobacter sp.]
MPPLELMIPFLTATAIFALTPGPGMLYMAVQTMAHGARAGWLSSFAFHLASYLHIFAAAFGVTVLLAAAPVLLLVFKIVGGCYLIWMGMRLWRRPKATTQTVQLLTAKPSRQAFRDSLFVEILNPKSALFYFAFLPQFATSEAALPIWVQIVALGIIANATFSLTDVVCIVFSRIVAAQASASARLVAWGRRTGGTILISMGARIIADAR